MIHIDLLEHKFIFVCFVRWKLRTAPFGWSINIFWTLSLNEQQIQLWYNMYATGKKNAKISNDN